MTAGGIAANVPAEMIEQTKAMARECANAARDRN